MTLFIICLVSCVIVLGAILFQSSLATLRFRLKTGQWHSTGSLWPSIILTLVTLCIDAAVAIWIWWWWTSPSPWPESWWGFCRFLLRFVPGVMAFIWTWHFYRTGSEVREEISMELKNLESLQAEEGATQVCESRTTAHQEQVIAGNHISSAPLNVDTHIARDTQLS